MTSVITADKPAADLKCRFCGHEPLETFVNLGLSPLCQTHVEPERLGEPETYYPLHAYVCPRCFLVQLQQFVAPAEIFSEYAYFSSYADSWVAHARAYCEHMRAHFGIGAGSRVIEIASNDGYLLQHFQPHGVQVLGVEPAANVAAAAQAKGIPTTVRFFGSQSARELAAEFGAPDLLLGNNVLAHVPDLNDFVAGMKILLAPQGVITMEFPHLLELMQHNQFDTIYHEHFSYFSFGTVQEVFARHGLTLFDVERLPTHGGSLRIYGCHAGAGARPISSRAHELLRIETAFGMRKLSTYAAFGEQVRETKRALLEFLIGLKRGGKRIVGYGAPGKGNTLLNYCGIGTDFLDFTVDRNPYKQGKFTPGMRIPILAPEALVPARPDYILILPWNLKDEILATVGNMPGLAARFVVPIPRVAVVG
ncbi:MAG: class I SAM-dependent methyltransferase [Gammaproteobacteria bacterium]|nr:class I SAM-dependent methyltransferase [Gammaproteobacteria bacterium]